MKTIPNKYAHIIDLLLLAEKNDKLPSSFLFFGPQGTIQKTASRILTEKLLETTKPLVHPDVAYLENSEERRTSVEKVRSFINHFLSTPLEAKRKIGWIFEAEKLTDQAQNALLKTLEEPPEHSIIFLFTSDRSKIKKTIRSRVIEIYIPKLAKKSYQDVLGSQRIASDILPFFLGRIERTETLRDETESEIMEAQKIFQTLYDQPKRIFTFTGKTNLKKSPSLTQYLPYWISFATHRLALAPKEKRPWIHAFLMYCVQYQKSSISFNFELGLENVCIQNT